MTDPPEGTGAPPTSTRRLASSLNRTELEQIEVVRGAHPGDQYLRVKIHPHFRRARTGSLVPREEAFEPHGRFGRALALARRWLIGRPLATFEEAEERVGKFTGLAIFASDNISSSAYASEEIMRVLVLAGIAALSLTLPITLAICVVLAVVVLSYREVIRGYPNGGGSYVVANDNLGPLAGLTAGAALLTDYVLTVSVSVAAGVAAITSAFPSVFDQRVTIMVVTVVFMTLMNLRGIRESGRAFAVPTYIYIVSILGLLGYGGFLFATDALPAYQPPAEWLDTETHHGEFQGL